MSTPKYIDYKSVRPQGFPSRVKKVEYYPQNLYSDIKPNDIVRFNINAPGFWDPYNCNFRIKVSFADMDNDGSVQLDGSAQSFINELIISTGSTEIERIQEYDVLASMLNDMTFDAESRSRERHQGLNSELFPTSNIENELQALPMIAMDYIGQAFGTDTRLDTVGFSTKIHGYKPTLKPVSVNSAVNDVELETPLLGKLLSGTNGYTNPFWGKFVNPVDLQLSTLTDSTKAVANSILQRADYGLYRSRDTNQVELNKSHITFDKNNSAHGSDGEFTYVGLRKPFNHNFAVGTFEDQFSKSFSTSRMRRGDPISTTSVANLYAEYTVPILSGSIGALIPPDRYKLIPAFVFDPLQIEVRINPNAIFTSGYIETEGPLNEKTDHPAFRSVLTGRQMLRTFKIVEFAIVVDIIQFDDATNNVVKQQLAGEGIVLHSNSYSLGPLYTISNTVGAMGTWQINMGFESLKSLLVSYISNDYLSYSFCRKLFKYSRNIVQLQTKIGLEYYPDKAYDAHGGEPDISALGSKNNALYLNDTLKAFGYSNKAKSNTILNKYNFALNQRPYFVQNTDPYLKNNMSTEQNTDTAYGWPMIHENRCVGRGFYVIDYSQNALDKNGNLSGVNTIQNRPFDLIVKSDGVGLSANWDRPCTMMIFCHYDFVLQISTNGVRVLGRG